MQDKAQATAPCTTMQCTTSGVNETWDFSNLSITSGQKAHGVCCLNYESYNHIRHYELRVAVSDNRMAYPLYATLVSERGRKQELIS